MFTYIYTRIQAIVQNRRTRRMSEILTIQDHGIEVDKGLRCLGTLNNNIDYEILEIKTRILAANNIYSSLQTIFRSKQIFQNNKRRLYKTLIKTVLCYGSVTWTLTQMREQMLCTFGRKILEEFTAKYKTKNVGLLNTVVKFRIYTKT